MKETLKEQMNKLYFLGFIVIAVISTILFAFLSSIVYKEQITTFSESILSLNINLLDSKLVEIRETQKAIVNDSKIREIIKYREENKVVDYSIELFNHRLVIERFRLLFDNLNIDNAYIVNKKGEIYYSFKDSFQTGQLSKENWFNEITERAILGTSYISRVHDGKYLINKGSKNYISIVMPFSKFDTNPEEYLICDMPLERLLLSNENEIAYAFIDNNNLAYMIIGNEIKVYNLKNRDVNKINEFLKKEVFKRSDIIIVSTKSKILGLEILAIKPLSELKEFNYTLLKIFALIICISALLATVISKKISDFITSPIKNLIKKCKMVSIGDYSVKFEKENTYEVNLLSEVIGDMLNNISVLNGKIIEEQKKITEEELRALQHQINPHFINNILQLIKSLSLSGENEKISKITTLLGKIMAYSVYQPYNIVSIKDELEHVKNYIDLQNIRFDGKISYSIECDEKLLDVKTLKLILQPLLENSIEHGIKSLKKGFLTISVEEEKNDIYILINDNGLGINEEKLKDLQENLKFAMVYNKEKSIGILNVNERLKRKYGYLYGVELVSKIGIGTTVIIKLPKNF